MKSLFTLLFLFLFTAPDKIKQEPPVPIEIPSEPVTVSGFDKYKHAVAEKLKYKILIMEIQDELESKLKK